MQPRGCPTYSDVPASHRFTSTALHDTHNVSGFHCGAPELDAWLRNHAMAASRARVAHTFVWTGASRDAEARVVAYYSLSAHAVLRGEAPSRISRGVADPVPAALIGKLALDQELHGQGLGAVLLADALERIISASASGLAVRAIVVDASTDRGRALYTLFGFVPAPGRAERMIVRAETIARGLGARSVPD
jgi:GNAT superfamily N-acetyltransferase